MKFQAKQIKNLSIASIYSLNLNNADRNEDRNVHLQPCRQHDSRSRTMGPVVMIITCVLSLRFGGMVIESARKKMAFDNEEEENESMILVRLYVFVWIVLIF